MRSGIRWLATRAKNGANKTVLHSLFSEYCNEFGPVLLSSYKRYCNTALHSIENYSADGEDDEDETIIPSEQKAQPKIEQFEESKNTLTTTVKSSKILSLEDLAEYAGIDPDIWEPTKQTANMWGGGDNPSYQIKGWFSRKVKSGQLSPEEYADLFRDLVKEYKPQHTYHTPVSSKVEDVMAEIAIMDFHFGQASWDKETRGKNYDIEIASKLLDETIDDFIAGTKGKVGKYLLPLGNDFFNVDNDTNTTNGGTAQDEDSNFKRTHLTAEALLITQIDKLSAIADVDVVCISGNHDKQRLWYLGEYLSAWYRNSSTVQIDNSPPQRKYYRWGKNLIGFTHGNNEVKGSLPLLMAQEKPLDFAETKYRSWHIGHLHGRSEKNTRLVKETNGIREMVLPSLVPLDAWHTGKGYGQLTEATCFLWDKRKGNRIMYNYHPDN